MLQIVDVKFNVSNSIKKNNKKNNNKKKKRRTCVACLIIPSRLTGRNCEALSCYFIAFHWDFTLWTTTLLAFVSKEASWAT